MYAGTLVVLIEFMRARFHKPPLVEFFFINEHGQLVIVEHEQPLQVEKYAQNVEIIELKPPLQGEAGNEEGNPYLDPNNDAFFMKKTSLEPSVALEYDNGYDIQQIHNKS